MKVTIVGLGYMGLPTALLFARAGHQVYGFDVNAEKIKTLKQGKMLFEEPGLLDLYKEGAGNFTCGTSIAEADAFVISVPTPFTKEKKCDNVYVISATESVARVLRQGNLVILESTVTPGTTETIVKPILDKAKKKYDLAYVSEKAIPGKTISEMQTNHRIIGGLTGEAGKRTKELYSCFVRNEIHLTDARTAEMAKLMENTFRDVNIALANEFAKLSMELGVNAWEAIELANLHPRVNIHSPGSGVGGHCIAIDPWFLTENTKSAKLIPTARLINDSQPELIFEMIKKLAKKGDSVAILGTAYKKNVDDDRESPSHEIIKLCREYGFEVRVHDPYVKGVEKSIGKVLKDAKIAVIATGHDIYKDVDFGKTCVLDCFNLGIKDAVVLGNGKKRRETK
ncbi:MAG: nucleotide sugar dehydrogenase [Nanoarchaeota archaeon]|nr:nucleotide sugar dehydrogenase [Nanoarchaeota archaeon]